MFKAFDEARRRSVERALNNTSSVLPLPWGYEYARRMQEIVGKDLMPYGVEANRVTLEAFLQYGTSRACSTASSRRRSCSRAVVQKSFRV